VIRTAVQRWGRLDHLINNAGATAVMPLAEAEKQTIVDLLALNVVAPSLLAREALPHLRRTSGSIINLSSTYGHRPMVGGTYYSAGRPPSNRWRAVGRWSWRRRAVVSTPPLPAPRAPTSCCTPDSRPRPPPTCTAMHTSASPLQIASADEVAHWFLWMADPAGRHATALITIDGGL
jgi:NAD(P)-dependent dehydrogenase (short-subunit alcohol dehydrogenase family)